MNKTNISFDLTVEILYSYIYEQGMTFDNIDKKFMLPSGTSESILGICNIFRFCGFKVYQGKRNIPLKSIYKLARVNNGDVTDFLKAKGYMNKIDSKYIRKAICEKKYARDIKNAFIKTAFDARLEELKSEREKMRFTNLSNSVMRALKLG